jgi:hypothetical protein
MALVVPSKMESTTQGHFPTFAKKASYSNGTCFFLLVYVGSGMKIGKRFVDDAHSTCLYVLHLCLVVSLHIVVVCVIFMAISLWFGEGLLSLICCEH